MTARKTEVFVMGDRHSMGLILSSIGGDIITVDRGIVFFYSHHSLEGTKLSGSDTNWWEMFS